MGNYLMKHRNYATVGFADYFKFQIYSPDDMDVELEGAPSNPDYLAGENDAIIKFNIVNRFQLRFTYNTCNVYAQIEIDNEEETTFTT